MRRPKPTPLSLGGGMERDYIGTCSMVESTVENSGVTWRCCLQGCRAMDYIAHGGMKINCKTHFMPHLDITGMRSGLTGLKGKKNSSCLNNNYHDWLSPGL